MCQNVSPETGSRLYAYWCMGYGTGSILFILIMFALRDYELFQLLDLDPVICIVIQILHALFALSYVIAGILLICGMSKDSATMFKIGKILTYPFVIVDSIFVFIVIIHVLAVPKLSEYRRSRWN